MTLKSFLIVLYIFATWKTSNTKFKNGLIKMSTIKQFYQMFSSLKITSKQLQDQVKALLFRKEVIPSSLEEVKTLILSF
jgi:hypothetical protein